MKQFHSEIRTCTQEQDSCLLRQRKRVGPLVEFIETAWFCSATMLSGVLEMICSCWKLSEVHFRLCNTDRCSEIFIFSVSFRRTLLFQICFTVFKLLHQLSMSPFNFATFSRLKAYVSQISSHVHGFFRKFAEFWDSDEIDVEIATFQRSLKKCRNCDDVQ